MFLPEVEEGNFTTYYRGSWVMVKYKEGKAVLDAYVSYRGGGEWSLQDGNRLFIPRNVIIDIQVPPLGYYVHNRVPVFAARVPARITTKGLCEQNSRCTVPVDYGLLSGTTVIAWSASAQPAFQDWAKGSIAHNAQRIGSGKTTFAVLSPTLLLVLNCTDGTKGAYSNLYYREFLIGKYSKDGVLIEGDMHILRQVGAA